MTTETELMFLEAQRRADEQMRQEQEAEAERQRQVQADAQSQEAEAARQAERERLMREAITPDTQEMVEKELIKLEQYAPGSVPSDMNLKSYKESIQEITKSLESLDRAREVEQSYIDAGVPMTPETRDAIGQMKAQALSPFVDAKKGTIDLAAAIKLGVSDQALRDIGIAQATIISVKRQLETQDRWRVVDKKTGEIVVRKRAESQAEYERQLAEYEQSMKEYEAAMADIARQEAAMDAIREKTPQAIGEQGGVFLIDALKGGVSQDTLKAAGFTQEQVDEAQKWVVRPLQERAEEAALLVFGKPLDELNSFQYAQAVEQAENIRMYTRETMPPAIVTLAAMEPITGTLYFWDEMDKGQRAFSIGMDVLAIFGGYLVPKVGGLVGKAITKTGVADDITRMITNRANAAASLIEKADPKMATTIREVVKVQGQYADDLLKADELQVVIKHTDDALKSGQIAKGSAQYQALQNLVKTSADDLANLQNRINNNAVKLQQLNDAWVDANRAAEMQALRQQVIKFRQASLAAKTPNEKIALIKEAARLENLEEAITTAWKDHNIGLYTKQLIHQITSTPSASEVNISINRVNKLIKSMSKAKGEKLAVLKAELNTEIVKLRTLEAGHVTEIHHRLVAVREAIDALEDASRGHSRIVSKTDPLTKQAYMGVEATSPYYDDIIKTLDDAKKTEAMLTGKLADYIKRGEKIYPEELWVYGRSGVATAIKPPSLKPMSGAGVTLSADEQLARLSATATAAQAAKLLGLSRIEIARIISRPVPGVETTVKTPETPSPGTPPGIGPLKTPGIEPAKMPELEPLPEPEAEPARAPAPVDVKQAQTGRLEDIVTEGAAEGESPIPIPVPTPIPEPTPVKPVPPDEPVKPPPPVPPPPPGTPPPRLYRTPPTKDSTDEEKRVFIRQQPNAVAWPQGAIKAGKVYHVVTYDNDGKNPRHFNVIGKAPVGTKLYRGPREAYKSITQISGKPPARPIQAEGGAVDPTIFRKADGTPGIGFAKDKRYRPKRRQPTVRESMVAPDVVDVFRGGRRKRRVRR